MRWYVYVYYDENHQPYYCGKGNARRAFHRKKSDVPCPPREQIVYRYFDDEELAYQLERNLIAFWGRQGLDPRGRLLNKSLGGPGLSGCPPTDKQKQASSKAITAWNQSDVGRKATSNHRKKFWRSKSLDERRQICAAGCKASAEKAMKDWVVTDPDGNEHMVHGLKPFCRQNNLSPAAMNNVARGKSKQHKGWTCRYA